ncbi:MAG: Xaa-Pro aminopeptidase [Chromatiales bacterium]|nr:Xaa-Pro aminopeptidase [Chromatiales bacterium]
MNPREFARRRRQLIRMMGRDTLAILPAAPPRLRNRDVQYPYRQDSDFYYLTGFGEPEAIALLLPGRGRGEYVLFCRERDAERETWDGARAGPARAVSEYGADEAFPIAAADDLVPRLLAGCERVYYTMGAHPEFDQRVVGWVTSLRAHGAGVQAPDQLVTLDHLLHDLRLYKSRDEAQAMRRAARIGMQAHRRAMAVCRPGLYEYQVEAEFLHEFRSHGARPSYLPIVGSGPNTCVLHYHANDRQLRDGDLLLVDAGCEYDYYASDITRTYPVNGRFTPEQRAIYEVVLEAHAAAIAAVGPGRSWGEPHDAAVRAVARGLRRLGLLDGTPASIVRSGSYKPFFMHRTGHWLGMDVHDVGDYKVADEWRVLEPGMALTVEPGIYIPEGMKGVPKQWWGIGVRIEDDVLVTADGAELLTADLPRDPDAIEALIGAMAA